MTADAEIIRSADRVVFPGVGAIRDCMAEIRRLCVDEMLREQVKLKPVLAICVGMQALMQHSEENGGVPCIGLFAGRVKRFDDHAVDAGGNVLKVPHMGWNQVTQTIAHPIWEGIDDASRFYFVHSYYAAEADHSTVSGRCTHGLPFTAAVARDNMFAVQFHPEKSQALGLALLGNFLGWRP